MFALVLQSATNTFAETKSSPRVAEISARAVSRFNDDFTGKAIHSGRWNSNSQPPALSAGLAQFRSSTHLFPYIWTKSNPFPETQKFSVEYRFRYVSISDRGTGIMVNGFAPAPASQPPFGTVWQFQVWQDTFRPLQVSFNGTNVYVAPNHDLNWHTAKWVRTDQDRIYLDDNLIHTAAISTANPKTIWIGNFSDNTTPDVWTGFDLDFVRVFRLP